MPKGKARKRRRPGRLSVWRLITIAAIVCCLPALVLAAFLIRYYFVFDRAIDARLGNRYEFNETEIYSAPATLCPEKAVSLPEVVARLRRLGYVESGTRSDGLLGTFRVEDENRLYISNIPGLPEDGGRSVEVRWSSGKVQAIVDESAGTSWSVLLCSRN